MLFFASQVFKHLKACRFLAGCPRWPAQTSPAQGTEACHGDEPHRDTWRCGLWVHMTALGQPFPRALDHLRVGKKAGHCPHPKPYRMNPKAVDSDPPWPPCVLLSLSSAGLTCCRRAPLCTPVPSEGRSSGHRPHCLQRAFSLWVVFGNRRGGGTLTLVPVWSAQTLGSQACFKDSFVESVSRSRYEARMIPRVRLLSLP